MTRHLPVEPAMTALAPSYTDLTGTYTLDPTHTRIGFVARHAMVTKVRGSFNEFEGTAVVDGTNPADSTVRVTIDAASIDTRNADRDAHLRSNDFLAMDEYPQITFVSTGVVAVDETTFEVSGDLTIKDVTKPVTVPFHVRGRRAGPVRQPAHRLRRLGHHQPQGLRHHLERRARDRRRAGQRQDRPRVRGLRGQERLIARRATAGRLATGGTLPDPHPSPCARTTPH